MERALGWQDEVQVRISSESAQSSPSCAAAPGCRSDCNKVNRVWEPKDWSFITPHPPPYGSQEGRSGEEG